MGGRRSGFAGIYVAVASIGLSGCHEGRVACLAGLPEAVQGHCGCSPPQQRVEAALRQSQLDDLVVTKFHACWTANGQGALQGQVDAVRLALSACLDKQMVLDPTIRATLDKIVEEAATPSSLDAARNQNWLSCSAEYTK